MVKTILKFILTMLGLVALGAAVIAVLIVIDSFVRPACNPYDTYDDLLTPQIYEDDGITDPREIKEIRFFAVPANMGSPCKEKRGTMTLLHTATDTEEIAIWLDAVKQHNWRSDAPLGATRHWMFLGMEFITQDERMTFFTVSIFNTSILMRTLDERRLQHEGAGGYNPTLRTLLRDRGLFDLLPGYPDFAREHPEVNQDYPRE